MGPFLLFTFLGAGLWNLVLALVGYFAYDLRDRILPYLDIVMYAVGAIFVLWLTYQGIKAYRRNQRKVTQ